MWNTKSKTKTSKAKQALDVEHKTLMQNTRWKPEKQKGQNIMTDYKFIAYRPSQQNP